MVLSRVKKKPDTQKDRVLGLGLVQVHDQRSNTCQAAMGPSSPWMKRHSRIPVSDSYGSKYGNGFVVEDPGFLLVVV